MEGCPFQIGQRSPNKGMLKKLIPKTGGLKYLVTVHVHCLDFPNGIPRLPEGSEELNVIWIRGAKLASTKAVPLASSSSSRNASMCIDEKMVLICTFYRKKDGSFDEKKSKFLIKAGPLGCCDRGVYSCFAMHHILLVTSCSIRAWY
mmetsp:Transcript_71140/g.189900  ORF Transcript_71140/g.189900 Transcript_71140/m.189900 type:complete len:147 (+) Transcript_71140:834-1274(+)